MAVIAKSQITIIDITDFKIQSNQPDYPNEGDSWINTGVSPYRMYKYVSGAWVPETDYEIIKEVSMTDLYFEDMFSDLKITPIEKQNLDILLKSYKLKFSSLALEATRLGITESLNNAQEMYDDLYDLINPLFMQPNITSDVSSSFSDDLSSAIYFLDQKLNILSETIILSKHIGATNLVLEGDKAITTTNYLLKKFYLSKPLNSNLYAFSISVKALLDGLKTGISIKYNGSYVFPQPQNPYPIDGIYTFPSVQGSMVESPEGPYKNYIEIFSEPETNTALSILDWVAIVDGNQPMLTFSPAPEDLIQYSDDLVSSLRSETSSSIAETRNEILTTVSSDYYTNDAANQFISNLKAEEFIRSGQWGVEISKINKKIDDDTGAIENGFNEFRTSFFVDLDGAHIKKKDSPNDVLVHNSGIDVNNSGVKVAWFVDGEAYNNKLTVNESLTVGKWQMVTDTAGNLNFKKVK